MGNQVTTVWTTQDQDGCAAELYRVSPPANNWYLSMIAGSFSGYPTIDLTREELKKIYDAIGEELRSLHGVHPTRLSNPSDDPKF